MSIIQDALNVYKKIVHTSLRDALLIASQEPQRRGIYSSSVVIWLMIFQRLNKDHSLSAALEHLCSGSLDDLLKEGSLPARSKKISSATGGLARARERVSLECMAMGLVSGTFRHRPLLVFKSRLNRLIQSNSNCSNGWSGSALNSQT